MGVEQGAVFLVSAGCQHNRCAVSDSFARQVNTALKRGKPFQVDGLTTFSWEKLYIFPPYTPVAAAARSLGGSVKDLSGTKIESSDQIALLVFVTHGQVVECIDFPRTQGDFAAVGESVLPRSTPLVGRVSGDDRIVVEIAR